MRTDLPAGTVTLVFTDIEGSTKLLHELGAEAYAEALAEHRRLLREAYGHRGGVEVDTQGDAFFYAFADAREAVAGAEEGREALRPGPIHVRVGVHTGTPHLGPEGYVGQDVHLGARIGAAGHGGQVLLSEDTCRAAGLAPDDTGSVLDLGEHRLKDFGHPVRILQLGAERFPPLKTISNTNLPRPASSFVGREREVEELTRLIRDDGARLVTLTGPGGSGKTRLAIEAAAELVGDHKAGTFWIELAPLRDPALVTVEIGKTIGAQDGLAEHVGEREMLLVLDNLEQVIDAAPELASLVEACPNLRLLVTSRERLRVRGEVEYPVAPLDEPDAVELFVARAGLDHADDDVRALCRALDDMPLAIELAAARASVLTPAQILERLSRRLDLLKGGRDADPRQRTLRSTIEWSHDLLDADEQRLFARLAVFVGGCTLETAEGVADADLDMLQSLVDKSLVRRTDDRFWMYETIHEFALERLEASGEAEELRRRHAQHFVALVDDAYDQRFVAARTWFRVMDDELDNVRAALDFGRDVSPAIAAKLAGAVAYYWALRGNAREARERLSAALERYLTRDRIRARALIGLATTIGMDRRSLPLLEEALAISREQRDPVGEALALEALGYKYIAFREEEAARRAFEESLSLRERAGLEESEHWYAVAGLCQLLIAAGEAAQAERMATELRELGERYANPDLQGDALHYLADSALIAGDFVRSEKRYRRALEHAREFGLAGQAVEELRGVAMSAAGQGNDARAVMLASLASAEREALGMPPLSSGHWWGRLEERFLGVARARLGPDGVAKHERAGQEAEFDSVAQELIKGPV